MKSKRLGGSQDTLVPVHPFPSQHSSRGLVTVSQHLRSLSAWDCGHSLQGFLSVPLRRAYETFPKLKQRMMTNTGLLKREISRRSQQSVKIMSLTVWGTEHRSSQSKHAKEEKPFPRVLVAVMPSPQICVKIPRLAISTPRKHAKLDRNPHVWPNKFRNSIFQPCYLLINLFYYFMRIGILPACVHGDHMCTWSPWRPDESTGAPGTRAKDSFEPLLGGC